jgi:hypothetical protein
MLIWLCGMIYRILRFVIIFETQWPINCCVTVMSDKNDALRTGSVTFFRLTAVVTFIFVSVNGRAYRFSILARCGQYTGPGVDSLLAHESSCKK